MVLNQNYALLSEGKTDAVGVLTESTVLQLESKITSLQRGRHTKICLPDER